MKVSFNELQSQSQKAFAGIGFDEGDANDAADMVVWMEAHGLNGIVALKKGLNFLLKNEPPHAPSVVYQDADTCVVDAHDQTILGNASLAIELGYAKSRVRGLSVTKIRHCHNRMLIIGYLARVAKRQTNVTAFWHNAHDPLTEILVSFKAGDPEPEICMYSLDSIPDDSEPNDGITLVMATHVNLAPEIRSNHPLRDLIQQSSQTLANRYARSMTDGIEVDTELWGHLKQLASKLLVEASEDSREGAGAGAGVNDND